MRFLVDECAGPSLARWLRNQDHDVTSVYDESRGLDDDRILITIDKDFGELIFRERRLHRGVVLLRLDDERAASKIAAVERLLAEYADRLPGRFVVVTEANIRVTSP